MLLPFIIILLFQSLAYYFFVIYIFCFVSNIQYCSYGDQFIKPCDFSGTLLLHLLLLCNA